MRARAYAFYADNTDGGVKMGKFILKRVGISLIVILLISVFSFSLVHMLPGDPAVLALGSEVTEAEIQAFREQYHLNEPVLKQYLIWAGDMLRGNFGRSITYRLPVSTCLATRLPATVAIGLPALIISSIVGILFGIISAVNRGKFIDKLLTFIETLGIGMPTFWLGMIGILVLGLRFNILPLAGYTPPTENFRQYVIKAIMPVTVLSFTLLASVARQMRSNMLEVINQDFIRTARANGLPQRSVIYKHALKNSLIPVITTIGMQVRVVVGGSLIVEQLFNIPGIGTLLVSAVNTRDYMVMQGCVFFISLFTVACNFVVDILYGFFDPRIRKSWR